MFSHLFDLGFKRTGLQALGFYIVYLIIVILATGLIAGILSPISGATSFEEGLAFGQKVGLGIVLALCVGLSVAVLHGKKQLAHAGYLLLVLASGFLAVIGGGVLGLIPAAYLTTLPIKQTGGTAPVKK